MNKYFSLYIFIAAFTPLVTPLEVIVAPDIADEIIGYIFDTETDGYSEKTEVLVGITTDGQIKGVELGINTRKNQYLASTFDTGLKKQFENIKAQEVELVSEARKKENDIQVVSGATISSKSIVNAVNAAVNLFNKMEG